MPLLNKSSVHQNITFSRNLEPTGICCNCRDIYILLVIFFSFFFFFNQSSEPAWCLEWEINMLLIWNSFKTTSRWRLPDRMPFKLRSMKKWICMCLPLHWSCLTGTQAVALQSQATVSARLKVCFDSEADRGRPLAAKLLPVWPRCVRVTVCHVITSSSVTCLEEVWKTQSRLLISWR